MAVNDMKLKKKEEDGNPRKKIKGIVEQRLQAHNCYCHHRYHYMINAEGDTVKPL